MRDAEADMASLSYKIIVWQLTSCLLSVCKTDQAGSRCDSPSSSDTGAKPSALGPQAAFKEPVLSGGETLKSDCFAR